MLNEWTKKVRSQVTNNRKETVEAVIKMMIVAFLGGTVMGLPFDLDLGDFF